MTPDQTYQLAQEAIGFGVFVVMFMLFLGTLWFFRRRM